jgi:phage shock protein A
MPGLFRRFYSVLRAEAHSIIDKLEDPIKLTEQGIRDLQRKLDGVNTTLEEVKREALHQRQSWEQERSQAADCERQAMLLLQQMKEEKLNGVEAENLATQALAAKQEALGRAAALRAEYEAEEARASHLRDTAERLRRTIRSYENDLATLKARARTAQSMKKINRQVAAAESASTIDMLERMKEKVSEDEALAEAYGELAAADREIDHLPLPGSDVADSLRALKKKLGMES